MEEPPWPLFPHIYIVPLQLLVPYPVPSIRIFEVLQTPDSCTMAAALPRKRAKFAERCDKVIPAVGL